MDIIAAQFTNWQTALEDFQKSVEKDLEEIRKQKSEIQQMKAEIINRLDQGQYIRDNNRVIISAPEIIIGNVDKSGTLWNGCSQVTIRANEINLEGVGSGTTGIGTIVSRAASIQQIAVDPGSDGMESVVKPTSEIVSQAQSITLRGETAEDFFPTGAPRHSKGIFLSTDGQIGINATKPCETLKKQLENQEKSLKTIISDLTKEMNNAKSETSSLITQLNSIAEKNTMNADDISTRTNFLDIDELQEEFQHVSFTLYTSMTPSPALPRRTAN